MIIALTQFLKDLLFSGYVLNSYDSMHLRGANGILERLVGTVMQSTLVLTDYYIRHILHDSEYYPNPDQFQPERFLKADGTLNEEIMDPSVACFGFGRRLGILFVFAYIL